MAHWLHFDEDAARLPEEMKRIGYDADTECYTFRDCYTGALYRSEPGNAYGPFTPVNSFESNVKRVRPNAFASADSAKKRSVSISISSFDDFLPPQAITSSTPPLKLPVRSHKSTPSGSRLADAFRRVKSMSLPLSKLQTVGNDVLHHRAKSNSVSSGYPVHNSAHPPRPPRQMRGYSKLLDPRREEALLHSRSISLVSNHAPTASTTSSIDSIKT